MTPAPERFRRAHALVTGASAGIGREVARLVARDVAALTLVARRQDRLEELAAELRAARPDLHVTCRAVDLADADAVGRLLDGLEQNDRPIDLLVNNAGSGDYGLFDRSDWKRLDAMLSVNVRGATQLLHRLVPPMVSRGFGAVMNVGSVAGFWPLAGSATYAASKAYLNHLSEGLRAELAGTGVTVTTVCPGPVPTEFQEVSGSERRTAGKPPSALAIDVGQCAAEAVDALYAGRPRVVTGKLMRAVSVVLEAVPKVALRPWIAANGRKIRAPSG